LYPPFCEFRISQFHSFDILLRVATFSKNLNHIFNGKIPFFFFFNPNSSNLRVLKQLYFLDIGHSTSISHKYMRKKVQNQASGDHYDEFIDHPM